MTRYDHENKKKRSLVHSLTLVDLVYRQSNIRWDVSFTNEKYVLTGSR